MSSKNITPSIAAYLASKDITSVHETLPADIIKKPLLNKIIETQSDVKPEANLLYLDKLKNGNKNDCVIEDDLKQNDEITNDDFFNFVDVNFEEFIKNQERLGIILKFNEEVRKRFEFHKNLDSSSEKAYFTYQGNKIYSYTGNSRNYKKIWNKFIKEFWNSNNQKDLRIKIYLDIYNDLDSAEQKN